MIGFRLKNEIMKRKETIEMWVKEMMNDKL
jgi:hypothetical protein